MKKSIHDGDGDERIESKRKWFKTDNDLRPDNQEIFKKNQDETKNQYDLKNHRLINFVIENDLKCLNRL